MRRLALVACVLVAWCRAAVGETFLEDTYADEVRPDGEADFVLIRGMYTSHQRYGFGYYNGPEGGWWKTDYEDSDRNFLRGLQRYTSLRTHSFAHKSLSLTDSKLSEYTFVYINMKRIPLGPGNGPDFKPEEAAALREFMLKGGFVMLDDFWGEDHWREFLVEYEKIFPDRPLQRLDTEHPIFHSFFDIDKITQVPGRMVTWNYGSGFYLDDPNYPPSVHAVLDDEGRVMMVANFNTDLGDGWEHTFLEAYPTEYINEAYRLGINFVIYALTH